MLLFAKMTACPGLQSFIAAITSHVQQSAVTAGVIRCYSLLVSHMSALAWDCCITTSSGALWRIQLKCRCWQQTDRRTDIVIA